MSDQNFQKYEFGAGMIARTSGPAEGVSAGAPQCTRAARCRSAREDRKPSLEISSDVLFGMLKGGATILRLD